MSTVQHTRTRKSSRPPGRDFARRAGRRASSRTRRARSAIAIPTRRRRATTGRACASCCSSRAACCAAPTATIRIPGISRTAPTFRPIRCSIASAISRPSLRALGGGLTISGGEPMVQLAFTRRIFAGAKAMGLHTAIETSGFLGDRADDDYLSSIDLVLLDIKSSDPDTYRRVTGRDLAPTLRFAERLASLSTSRCGCASRSCPARPTIPPMSTASPASSRR